jgi:hypothetical protein
MGFRPHAFLLRLAPGILLMSGLAAAKALPVVLAKSGPVRTESLPLSGLQPGNQYSILYSLDSLSDLRPEARVEVEVRQGGEVLVHKVLHAGDADLYAQFRVPHPGSATLAIHDTDVTGAYHVEVNRWQKSSEIKSAPSHRWQDALAIPLGQTVFAYGDDAEYIPLPGTPRKSLVDDPNLTDWYKFEFAGERPKLVFFQIDLMERDQVPVNVAVYRESDGKPVEYLEGEDPVTLPHEVQALAGNKFTPRLLKEPGTYWIAVRASHPEYKLRTRVYDVPPYSDPHEAVRTGLDYILAAGDSWHANTPRRGGVFDRVSSVHQETSLCVACHVTHFSQRAQLYAARNGYPVVQRQQLQFLAERFYNNPRPFYGFEQQGAVWSRVISAPANVLGRMSHLMDIYEDQITGERRESFHKGIVEYLKLYYAGRDKLPADETNGNTPIVSAHEIAWYAWTATKDPKMAELMAAGDVKNVTDLCYQTLGLADIDSSRYASLIQKNIQRLFSLQRPDGQWSYKFEADQAEVEFQTGHVLWTLKAAGVPITDPHVVKALHYLLGRQQSFGGWLDPQQSFENFRTPFRETQFAAMGLSAYYPLGTRAKGWNAPAITKLSSDPVHLLEQLDNVWDPPSDAVRKQIVHAAESNDALIRQAAVEALGRLGKREPVLLKLLGDPSKMVQRTAAWAVRQTYSRHEDTPSGDLLAALQSNDDRTRWGATRIFAQHFSTLARRPEIAAALLKLDDDRAVSVRMMAIKGSWQLWFWTPDATVKSNIEDTLLAQMQKPQGPWIESNLHDAIYNLADENIRYLYNNWVPLMGEEADRERAIRGRLAIEARLANKFTSALDTGSNRQKKELLHFLTEFPLRRADVYDLNANLDTVAPPLYNRIGNDIEQIVFFGKSAERFAHSLQPLFDSNDPEMRRLAAQAALLVRDTRFAAVNRISGPMGPQVYNVMLKVQAVPEGAAVARVLKPSVPVTAAAAASPVQMKPTAKLDEAYFRGYVEPILERKGKDGYACAQCHESHAIFRATYETALRVVDPQHPENSLMLRKPTSNSESEGVPGALAHGGGVRFTKDSPEYATILAWIKGAKE